MVEEEPYVYYQGAKVPKAVTHVVIDPLVQIIERQAFAHCHALKSVSFPGALPTTGSNTTGSQLTRIGEFAFAECTSLKSIQIPASVEKIESSAFESCHFLKSVTFQRVGTSLAGLTHVGDDAFCNCYSLKSIEFPPSLTFLGIGAFFDCSCLTSVSFGHEESSLAHIGSNAFQSCRALKTIRIPACVTEIYDGTFEDCVDLQSVEFLEPSVLTEMGSRAFEGCTSLVTFVLPKPLLKLGAYAFQGQINAGFQCFSGCPAPVPDYVLVANDLVYHGGADHLIPKDCTKLVISSSVRVIKEGAFKDFYNLDTITIPSFVEEIEADAFFGCCELESIDFDEPSSLRKLGARAFASTGLRSIRIPASVGEIGANAFKGCDQLESIALPKSTRDIDQSVFEEFPRLSTDHDEDRLEDNRSSLFLGRYKLCMDGPPLYKSATCVVIKAVDVKVDELGERLVEKNGAPRELVFKFMRNKDQFEREINARRGISSFEVDDPASSRAGCDIDRVDALPSKVESSANFVLSVLKSFDADTNSQFSSALNQVGERKNACRLDEYKYAVLMPCADQNLDTIFRNEKPDRMALRKLASDLATALEQIHECGIVHGDIKLLNVVRLNDRLRLIDFEAAVKQNLNVGVKFSSGVLPPEMIAKLNSEETLRFEQYFAGVKEHDEVLWRKIAPRVIGNKGPAYVVKTVLGEHTSGIPQEAKALPYDPVQATPAIDIWSFGVLLFTLCTGSPLFGVNRDDDLDSAVAMKELYEWTDAVKVQKLRKVADPIARQLLIEILSKGV